jgi:hypothetical protein
MIAVMSIPGSTAWAGRANIRRFFTSERTAVAIPGYWTFTATSR